MSCVPIASIEYFYRFGMEGRQGLEELDEAVFVVHLQLPVSLLFD
jgi:hypothetical protein